MAQQAERRSMANNDELHEKKTTIQPRSFASLRSYPFEPENESDDVEEEVAMHELDEGYLEPKELPEPSPPSVKSSKSFVIPKPSSHAALNFDQQFQTDAIPSYHDPAYLSVPSFTGTTTTEAIRYNTPFVVRFMRSSRRNNLVLMAGGIAYSTLLSSIPLFALIFVILSGFFEEKVVIDTISTYIRILFPGEPKLIMKQLAYVLEHRRMFSGLNVLFLLFFSSMAFSMLENAMSVIYAYDKTQAKRKFWVSATLPYLYMGLIFTAILFFTVIATMFQKSGAQPMEVFGIEFSSQGVGGIVLSILGFVGLSCLLASLYIIMPKCPISFRRAFLGGVVAALLWEGARRVLVWYFSHLSPVQELYGPLATVIVVLISLELGALILLFGAQVIAELERFQTFQRMAAPTVSAQIRIDSVK